MGVPSAERLAAARRCQEDDRRTQRGLVHGILGVRRQLGAQQFGGPGRLHHDLAQQGGHPVRVGGDRRLVRRAVDDELGCAGLAVGTQVDAGQLARSDAIGCFRLDVQVDHLVAALQAKAEPTSIEPFHGLVAPPFEPRRQPTGEQHRLRHRRCGLVDGRVRIRPF